MQRSKRLFIEIVAELRKDPPPYTPNKDKEKKEKKEKMSNSR